jgi:hypothetical protein
MTDTIDARVMQRVTESISENIRPREDVFVHTLTITVNGAHGGVDVTAEMDVVEPVEWAGSSRLLTSSRTVKWQVR